MLRYLVPLLAIALFAGTSARAQPFPERGGRGGRGRPPSGGSSGSTASPTPARKPAKPANQIEIVGVVRAIDPDAKRVTIAYEAVDELNWPPGTMPFAVYKAELLETVRVGDRVRFKLDGQQITELTPY
jgi:Cu/Ag efflux protein CusF